MSEKTFDVPFIGKVKIINFPKTMTVLALGFLAANLFFVPAIAALGKYIPEAHVDAVGNIAGLFKDGMLLILGYYFRDKMRQEPEEGQ